MLITHKNLLLNIAFCATLVVASIMTIVAADAHGYSREGLEIKHPWTRVAPPGAKVAVGFMKITNTGKEADRLIGGSFALSDRVEVHEMSVTDGVMRMGEVKGGLEVVPGATVVLEPGSYHLMLMGLSGSPKLDERVKGTLRFEKAGDIEVEFAVAPLGAKSHSDKNGSPDAKHEHGGHDMKHHH